MYGKIRNQYHTDNLFEMCEGRSTSARGDIDIFHLWNEMQRSQSLTVAIAILMKVDAKERQAAARFNSEKYRRDRERWAEITESYYR